MPIFNVQMRRSQTYAFTIEAKDDDEALDVANEVIEEIENYDLNYDGWSAESHEIIDLQQAEKEKTYAIRDKTYVLASDVFTDDIDEDFDEE